MKKIKIKLTRDYILLKGINYKVETTFKDKENITYEITLNENIKVSDIYMVHNPSLELFRAIEVDELDYVDRWSSLGKFMY